MLPSARSRPSDTWLILNNDTCPTPPTGEQRGFSCTVVGKPTRTCTTSRSTTRAQSPTVRVAGDQELLCSPTRRWFWHTGNPPLLRLISSSYSSTLRNESLLRAAPDCSLRQFSEQLRIPLPSCCKRSCCVGNVLCLEIDHMQLCCPCQC